MLDFVNMIKSIKLEPRRHNRGRFVVGTTMRSYILFLIALISFSFHPWLSVSQVMYVERRQVLDFVSPWEVHVSEIIIYRGPAADFLRKLVAKNPQIYISAIEENITKAYNLDPSYISTKNMGTQLLVMFEPAKASLSGVNATDPTVPLILSVTFKLRSTEEDADALCIYYKEGNGITMFIGASADVLNRTYILPANLSVVISTPKPRFMYVNKDGRIVVEYIFRVLSDMKVQVSFSMCKKIQEFSSAQSKIESIKNDLNSLKISPLIFDEKYKSITTKVANIDSKLKVSPWDVDVAVIDSLYEEVNSLKKIDITILSLLYAISILLTLLLIVRYLRKE